jgi:hypothetical protein
VRRVRGDRRFRLGGPWRGGRRVVNAAWWTHRRSCGSVSSCGLTRGLVCASDWVADTIVWRRFSRILTGGYSAICEFGAVLGFWVRTPVYRTLGIP